MAYQSRGVQAVFVSVDWFRGRTLLELPNRNIVLLVPKLSNCELLYGEFL